MYAATADDPAPYGYFVQNDDLSRAIGRVALEATTTDEALREILTCILGINAMLLFEGQSSDWLVRTTQAAVDEFAPRLKYAEADRVIFDSRLQVLEALRKLRNCVVHGIWTTRTPGFEDDVLPRPWGNSSDDSTAYWCIQSRLRKWGSGQLFTVGDVNGIAVRLATTTELLAKAFIRMNDGNGIIRRGSFARWNLDDIHHPNAAWEEPL